MMMVCTLITILMLITPLLPLVVASRNGSYANDCHYAESMLDYPSPALFVYTLPNTVTGEIAIRNKWAGETSAFVLEGFDGEQLVELLRQAFQDAGTQSAMLAWIDCPSDTEWTAAAWLLDREEALEEPLKLKLL